MATATQPPTGAVSPPVADPLAGACAPTRFRPRLLLLVIDPGPAAPALAAALGSGVDVRICATATEGLLVAGGARPDAVLISADLPDVPAPTLVGLLRRCCAIPVIVGASDGYGRQAADALDAGASVCIPHPYPAGEVRALLRAIRPAAVLQEEPVLRCGELVLDPAAHTVRLRGALVNMPPQEFRMLHFLMAHAGKVVTRDQLWAGVWGGARPAASNTITVHVRRLRLRLGDDAQHPQILTTVGGGGYRLESPPNTPAPAVSSAAAAP
mgnify:CR=1 FL=1